MYLQRTSDGDIDLDKKVIQLGVLNEIANEALILSINTSSSVGKVAFGLVQEVQRLLRETAK